MQELILTLLCLRNKHKTQSLATEQVFKDKWLLCNGTSIYHHQYGKESRYRSRVRKVEYQLQYPTRWVPTVAFHTFRRWLTQPETQEVAQGQRASDMSVVQQSRIETPIHLPIKGLSEAGEAS